MKIRGMKNREFNFTKAAIQNLPIPEKGMVSYRDTKEKGLSIYVTSKGVMSFFVRKRIIGRDERVVLGQFPTMSIEQARKRAQIVKGQVAQGGNPNNEKTQLRGEITFGEMVTKYIECYSKKEKKSWRYDVREFNKFLSHWFKRKLSSITNQDVRNLHQKIRSENGLYQANRLLERVRALYNKAIKEWGWKGVNPTDGIKKYKEIKRDRFLSKDELPRFFKAVSEEPSETIRDYILLSLLTGARKSNVLSMSWKDIDFHHKTWRIPDTKNGEPVVIPLIDQAIDILQKRKETQEDNCPWVFPSKTSASGHLMEPKKAWQRILKNAEIEDLRIHDLRRTLGSYQAITGASLSVIGKSMGHKSQQATQIYARLSTDPVRESLTKAVEAMNI